MGCRGKQRIKADHWVCLSSRNRACLSFCLLCALFAARNPLRPACQPVLLLLLCFRCHQLVACAWPENQSSHKTKSVMGFSVYRTDCCPSWKDHPRHERWTELPLPTAPHSLLELLGCKIRSITYVAYFVTSLVSLSLLEAAVLTRTASPRSCGLYIHPILSLNSVACHRSWKREEEV